jgi:hypothetical protein
MDLFLVFAYQDLAFAEGLADTFRWSGLEVGPALSLWPGMRLLALVDQGLVSSRRALVIVSRDFLKFSYPRKELDGLTTRRKVVSLLSGIGEEDVQGHSPRLAVASYPQAMADRLPRLFLPAE